MCSAACVVGWAFGVSMTADLVTQALNMALITRKPQSVIHHSDQGSQYTSIEFGNCRAQMGIRPLKGSVGYAYADMGFCHNALAESFFATLECELIDHSAKRHLFISVLAYHFVHTLRLQLKAWGHRRQLGDLAPDAGHTAARHRHFAAARCAHLSRAQIHPP